jgi:hypothetical protein
MPVRTKLWRVVSPKPIRSQAMRLELLNALRRMGTKVRADFAETTSTWSKKNKPNWGPSAQKVSVAGGKATLEVTTDHEIYRFLDQGTEEHGIAPRGPGMLAFNDVFEAKTTPGVIKAEEGYSGGDKVFRYDVLHPGFEARKFAKTIADKWRKDFRKEMDVAMERVKQASGHAL